MADVGSGRGKSYAGCKKEKRKSFGERKHSIALEMRGWHSVQLSMKGGVSPSSDGIQGLKINKDLSSL